MAAVEVSVPSVAYPSVAMRWSKTAVRAGNRSTRVVKAAKLTAFSLLAWVRSAGGWRSSGMVRSRWRVSTATGS
jgi:hypothetical protein